MFSKYCLLFSLVVYVIIFIEIYLTFYSKDVSYFKTPEESATQVNALQSGNGRIVTSTFSAMPSPQCIGRDIRSDIVWLGPADWCGKEAPGLFQNSTPAWFASSWTYEPQSGHLFYNEAKKGLMCLSSKDGKGHPLRVVKCAAKDASQKFAVFTFNYKQSTSFAIGKRTLFTFNCISKYLWLKMFPNLHIKFYF